MANKKILIVDDEPNILTLLESRLKSAGYDVIKANNGKDALFLAYKEKPNLILLDIVMPGIDGSQVSEALKNNPVTSNIPVIFLTCLITKEEELKKKSCLDCNFFISKPFNSDELLVEISKHVS